MINSLLAAIRQASWQWMGIVLALVCAAPAWAASASLLDGPQLTEVMKGGKPCCVIDARSEGLRKQAPIPFAVVYHEGLSISQTSFAVVIAEYDMKALLIARGMVTSSGRDVYAVKGGYTVWLQTQIGGAGPQTPKNFTIPSNTCEQGKALQEFK